MRGEWLKKNLISNITLHPQTSRSCANHEIAWGGGVCGFQCGEWNAYVGERETRGYIGEECVGRIGCIGEGQEDFNFSLTNTT